VIPYISLVKLCRRERRKEWLSSGSTNTGRRAHGTIAA
jgi:hypothetical protein